MSSMITTRTIVFLLIGLVIGAAGASAFYYYTAPVPEKKLKIAVVSDVGGRGDLSFNDMGFKGGEEACRDFNLEMVEIISKVEADYVPNLEIGAKDPDVILVVGVGYMLSNALAEVAMKYPDKNFAGIDTFAQFVVLGQNASLYPLPNLLDIVYEEHKGSAMVGALGALLAAYYGYPHIGVALGMEIPPLWKFEVGYKWGCDWAINWTMEHHPELTTGIVSTARKERVLWTYTGTFSDITKGYEAAKAMYAGGAVAVYNVAGPLGFGINQAVEEIAAEENLTMGPPFWIGVDSDQDWIGPGFVVASCMKRVDYGVYYATMLSKSFAAVFYKTGIPTFRETVAATSGSITLGIGTMVGGVLMEGISLSTLADLPEFIAMGQTAEEITGTTYLPATPAEIVSKVTAMRAAIPSWIWDAVKELSDGISSGSIVVPKASTTADMNYWRGILG